jgi:hypothetical protein
MNIQPLRQAREAIKHTTTWRLISSFMLLIFLAQVTIRLLTYMFESNLLLSLPEQALRLTIGFMILIGASTINPLLIGHALGKGRAQAFKVIKTSSVSLGIGCLVTFALWSTTGFKSLWPSPLPITASLFLVLSIEAFILRQRKMAPMDRALAMSLTTMAYLWLVGVFNGQFDLIHEDLMVWLGSSSLMILYCVEVESHRHQDD